MVALEVLGSKDAESTVKFAQQEERRGRWVRNNDS